MQTGIKVSSGKVHLLAVVLGGAAITQGAVARSAPAIQTGDPVNGKRLYGVCGACHSIDENDLGPLHRGVVGRPAASVADYAYSAALKASDLTWTEANLDRWLTNPSAMVPGTKMYFMLDNAQSRADIISYLKTLK